MSVHRVYMISLPREIIKDAEIKMIKNSFDIDIPHM